MNTVDNPWLEVFDGHREKTTDNIVSYFEKQAKMLGEASGGRIKGMFALTKDANRSISAIMSASLALSETLTDAVNLGAMGCTSATDLLDANGMYKRQEYCFEVRSDRYRFRLLTLVFGPLYPVTMNVDRGVCDNLAKFDERFAFSEDMPCEISVADDADLDKTFRKLLESDKLKYICSRLMEGSKR